MNLVHLFVLIATIFWPFATVFGGLCWTKKKKKMAYTANGPIDLQAADIPASFRFVRRYWLWTWIKKLSTKDKGASYQSALKGAWGRVRQWLLSCRGPAVSLHGERAGGPAWRTHRWRSHPFLLLSGVFTGRLRGLRVYFETSGIKRWAYLSALYINPFEAACQRHELPATGCLRSVWLTFGRGKDSFQVYQECKGHMESSQVISKSSVKEIS